MKKITLALALVAATTAFANAQRMHTPTPPVREYNQAVSIEEGLRRGTITPKEAKQLQKEQKQIDKVIRRAKADGIVTPRERAEIDRLQDHLRLEIAHQSRDTDRRRRGF